MFDETFRVLCMSTLLTGQNLGRSRRGEVKFEAPEVKAEWGGWLVSGEVLVTVGTFGTNVAL